MNKSTILALAIAVSSIAIVSGTNICDNAPCEPQINASLGKEFTISFESNPSTGFEWWTKFDPAYLSLTNSIFVSGNEKSGMVGVPGKETFTLNAKNAGNTDVIMLLLQPWENGTIAERKIFPINIISSAAPKQADVLGGGINPEHTTISKSSFQSSSGMGTNTISNGQTTTTSLGTSSSYFFKNESVMETLSQASSQIVPDINDLSPHGKPSL